jgi:hypothetical protein
MVQTVTIYGAEAWGVIRKNGNKLLPAEMDCLRRSRRRTRLYEIRNETIIKIMETEKDAINEV